MVGRIGSRIVAWVGTQCRARRLLEGGRQHERLVRKIGKAAEAAAGWRLPSALWKRHGETIYRQFKLDPAQVPAEAHVLCRQLHLLEGHLSRLARSLGPLPTPKLAAPHLPAQARASGPRAARVR